MPYKLSRVAELFGQSTAAPPKQGWRGLIARQSCPYLNKKCIKIRKSQPDISIGTCTVKAGAALEPIIICPHRLLERRQIFLDCLHLLTDHQPGNELHVLTEVKVPGGNVDFVIASVLNGSIKDFVGLEIQTLDTTGTVWPERQRFLKEAGIRVRAQDTASDSSFGMNWKMTAKTILVQIHHKVETFQHINKHFVLAIQDNLLTYMQREFSFDHLTAARPNDTIHFHSYRLHSESSKYRISLSERLSTDVDGVKKCLGLFSEAKVELSQICKSLELKISEKTLFKI